MESRRIARSNLEPIESRLLLDAAWSPELFAPPSLLSGGVTAASVVCSTDDPYHTFSLPFPALVTVDLVAIDAGVDPALEVLDDSGRLLEANDDISREQHDSRVVLSMLPGRTYYLKTRSTTAAQGQYWLQLTSQPVGEVAPLESSIVSIKCGANGSAKATGTIAAAGETDTFSILAGKTGRMTVDMLAGRRSQIDSCLRVTDASGIEMAANDNAGGTLTAAQLQIDVVKGRRYILQASGTGGTVGAYSLAIATAAPAAPANQPPSAGPDAVAAAEDTPASFNVLTNDSDADGDGLIVTAFDQPAHGSLTHLGAGAFTYNPASDYSGTDGFTYTISDGRGGSTTGTVTITVAPVNDAPSAADDHAQTTSGVAVAIAVLTNDSDPESDLLHVASFSQPSYGTVSQNADGTLSYTPAAGFAGLDSFAYVMADAGGLTSQAVVTVDVAPSQAGPVVFFVAPTGSDSAVGDLSHPFATFERARDAIRALKSTSGLPSEGVTVYVRGGVYQRSTTLELTSLDSGTAGAPITWQAYGDEQVRVVGGVKVAGSAFTTVTSTSSVYGRLDALAKGNVMVANLKSLGITDYGQLQPRAGWGWTANAPMELFYNGAAMDLGRWPNEGFDMTATVPASNQFTTTSTRMSRWTGAQDVWFSGLFGTFWYNSMINGTVNASTRTVTLKQTPAYGVKTAHPYYAFNLLEEIDTPGEYYIDRVNGLLYFWAPSSLSTGDVQLSMMSQELLRLNQTSYISFEGMTFEATRGGLVKIIGGSHNRLDDVVLRNAGTFGATITGTDNGIQNSKIYDVGETGVSLNGGNRPTLTKAGNFVVNSELYRWGRWVRTSKMGIYVEGVGQIISHNEMHDAPHQAIWFYGNEHEITYNEIYRVCSESADAGAIYAGRDWGYRGTEIAYNYIHDLSSPFTPWQVFGVYLDDAVSGMSVHGNVFYKINGYATFNGGGRDNLIYNNLVARSYGGHRTDRRGTEIITNIAGDDCNFLEKLRLASGGNFKTGAWGAAYPELAPIPTSFDLLGTYKNPGGSTFTRNWGYANQAGKWMNEGTWGGTGALGWYANTSGNVENQDPLFVDEASGNLNIKSTSPVLKLAGWQPILFDLIGIQPLVQ